MKRNNFKKILVLLGLIGNFLIINVNAMRNNEKYFNFYENMKLICEDDKIMKYSDGSDVTSLTVARRTDR